MYDILLHKNAISFYEKTNSKLKQRIESAIDKIGNNPYHSNNIKKLHGKLDKMYRYKTGKIRIIYEIHEEIKTVSVKAIDYRGNVY